MEYEFFFMLSQRKLNNAEMQKKQKCWPGAKNPETQESSNRSPMSQKYSGREAVPVNSQRASEEAKIFFQNEKNMGIEKDITKVFEIFSESSFIIYWNFSF